LASYTFRPLSDVCQVFQTDDGFGCTLNNAFRDCVIGLQLQPSLSSTNRYQAASSRTSAFALQAFSEPSIVICLGTNLLARIKEGLARCCGCNRQIALFHIYPDNVYIVFKGWIGNLYFKAY